ncbi:unnamed protein product, partial [Phaeothamnion confervicola]
MKIFCILRLGSVLSTPRRETSVVSRSRQKGLPETIASASRCGTSASYFLKNWEEMPPPADGKSGARVSPKQDLLPVIKPLKSSGQKDCPASPLAPSHAAEQGQANASAISALQAAVSTNDALAIAKALVAENLLPSKPGQIANKDCGAESNVLIQAEPAQAASHRVLIAAATDAMRAWQRSLKVGDDVDILCLGDSKWYTGRIIEIEQPVATVASCGGDAAAIEDKWCPCTKVMLHFQGWTSKFDEWRCQLSPTLQPVYTHTKPRKKPAPKKWAPFRSVEEVIEVDAEGTVLSRTGTDGVVYRPFDPAVPENAPRNRFGRVIINPHLADSDEPFVARVGAAAGVAAARRKEKKARMTPVEKAEAAAAEEAEAAAAEAAATTAAVARAARRDDDENGWICSICDEMDTSDMDELLICDGPCNRSFHTSCVGALRGGAGDATKLTASAAAWLCADC